MFILTLRIKVRPFNKYFACGLKLLCQYEDFFSKIAQAIYCSPYSSQAGCITFVNLLYFLQCKPQWYAEKRHILQIQKWSSATKKHAPEIASLQKLKTM